jgi:3-hydroxyacyl-CoA dehydrogenase
MKPSWDDIELLVVGAGTMGASLAQTYAQSGFAVGLLDVSDEIVQQGLQTIERELEGAKGKIFTPKEILAIRERVLGTTSYPEACKGRNLKLVIEAATERLDIKKDIFKCLDSLSAPHVVFASNSSSLDTNVLAEVTKRPDKIVWMHYFYLPHKNRAAEYAGTVTASGESKAIARKYLKLGGKIPTHVRGSRKGGVADVIFVALLLEATRMLEEDFDIAAIEAAGKKAYGIPIGFLELMDATGLPVGLHAMRSFSDSSNPNDQLHKVYGNFFTPRQNYVALIDEFLKASDKSTVRWVKKDAILGSIPDQKIVDALADRFLAIGFLTAAETVDAGLITIEDLELLTQNAFLWREGPFTLMNLLGKKKVHEVVEERADHAKTVRQDFPICKLLKKETAIETRWQFHLAPVYTERERSGAIRRITLSNPKAANAMSNEVFAELKQQFTEANEDDQCKVIIFDTAPIKTFIAGAHIPTFIERIKAKEFDVIKRDTEEWQRVIFHVMTGTSKPKIAIVDGQALGGGVEVAAAFTLDPNAIVIATNRTSFSLPETRLGIYPGLRGTLTFPQVIYRKTGDPELAVALSRYYTLAGGTVTSSPQILHHLGFADVLVPMHRRDEAANVIASMIIANDGQMIPQEKLETLDFERLDTRPSFEDRRELQVARDLFCQADVLPTMYANARGHLQSTYTGEMRAIADRASRRLANNSPNAVWVANYLISRGFDGFLRRIDNDTLAAFELEYHLRQVFEHPDALIGLEGVVNGKMVQFRRRYPF